MKPQSFFDADNVKDQKKIWDKPEKDKKEIKNLQPSIQFEFLKTCKKKGKSKSRFVLLENNTLYATKSQKKSKIIGQIELSVVKCEWLIAEDAKTVFPALKDVRKLYGFRLSRNERFIELYTEDQQVYEEWKRALQYKIFQTTFHDEFTVTKMIGKGSFAKVYFATKNADGKNYAIKAFNKEYMASQHKGKQSLVNEIRIMRNLQSDYCLRLYEMYETTNSIYFVIDLLQGGELLNRVRQEGKFNVGELSQIMINLMRALAHLHEKNIMHRDLKPENILCRSKGKNYDLVLADFGLATFQDDPDMLFKRCGTPGFVAPEILLYDEGDKMYTTQCDVFSAGVIFYLLLTGKQPFNGADYKEILRANKSCKINYDLPIIQEFEIPKAIDLLKAMLQAEPEKRPTAKECLAHEFLTKRSNSITALPFGLDPQKLKEEDNFKKALKDKTNVDSQEKFGSLALKTNSKPALNGQVDTVDKIGTSNFDSSHNIKLPMDQKISQFARQNSLDSQGQKEKKERKSKNLHKIAIKNNLQNQKNNPMEEYKAGEQLNQAGQSSSQGSQDDSDEDVDDEVSDEGGSRQISQNMEKMNMTPKLQSGPNSPNHKANDGKSAFGYAQSKFKQ